MDDAATARAKAEARRAKILARQKDRLSTITGVYSQSAEQAPATATAPAQPSASAVNQKVTAAHAPIQQAGSVDVSQQQQQQQGQQQASRLDQDQKMAALMQMMEQQLRHAQVLQQATTLPPEQQAHQEPSSTQTESRNSSNGTSSRSAGQHSTAAAGSWQEPLLPDTASNQPPMQAVPQLLQLGPALARSVKQTQLFRLLAALLLAYAALSGWQMPVPPVVLLMVSDMAVVLAGAAVLPGGGPDGAGPGAQDADFKMPQRLRSFDVLSLVPGLRELLHALSGYQAVTTAVSQDFAAYVVALGLLSAAGQVPGWYVPRMSV